MKNAMKPLLILMSVLSVMSLTSIESCFDKDPDDPDNLPALLETGKQKEYVLYSTDGWKEAGTVVLKEMGDNSTNIIINMDTGKIGAAGYTANLQWGTVSIAHTSGSVILRDLNNFKLNESSLQSKTNVWKWVDNRKVDYEDMLKTDGCIVVKNDNGDIAAMADIGENALTGEFIDYDLGEKLWGEVNGRIAFYERESGDKGPLAVITLDDKTSEAYHPVQIQSYSMLHYQSAPVLFQLNYVNGNDGLSLTDLKWVSDSIPEYNELKNFDAHVLVFKSRYDDTEIISRADIGGNELTGRVATYSLTGLRDTGIYGEAFFRERKNGVTLVEIRLVNLPENGRYSAGIYSNSLVEGGNLLIRLNDVYGSIRRSYTDVRAYDENNIITYSWDEMLQLDGHILIRKGDSEMNEIVAGGNIGSN